MIVQKKIFDFSKFVEKSRALEVLQVLEEHGYEAYIAGGAVRDMLLNKEPKDFDIATNARPKDIKRIFPKHTTRGERFGTIGVVLTEKIDLHNLDHKISKNDIESSLNHFEVTTYRSESVYSDLRHPDSINFSDTIFEDSRRRDFTINSLYADKNGVLYDPQNGIQDLESKIIRTVGDPDQRFNEDGLRVLRAFRFASQLGFAMDSVTQDSAIANWSNLSKVSSERFYEEFKKMVLGPYFDNLLPILIEKDLFDYFINVDENLNQNSIIKKDRESFEHNDFIKKNVLFLQERIRSYKDSQNKFENFILDLAIFHSNKVLFEAYLKYWINFLPLRKEERQRLEEGLHFCNILIKKGNVVSVGHVLRLGFIIWSLEDFKLFVTDSLLRNLQVNQGPSQKIIQALDSITQIPSPIVKAKDLIQRGVKIGPDLKKLENLAFEIQLENPQISSEELFCKILSVSIE